MNLDPVRDSLDELIALAERAQDTADMFKDATLAVAAKSEVSPAALRAYVKTKIKGGKAIDKKTAELSDFIDLAGEFGRET